MRLVVVHQEDVELASTTILVLRELGLKYLVGVLTMEISTIVGFGTFTSSGPWWDIVWRTTVVRRATHEEIAYAAARTFAA